MKKQILSVILAVLLCLSITPMSAHADSINVIPAYSNGVINYTGAGYTANTSYIIIITNGTTTAALGNVVANGTGAISGSVTTGKLTSGYIFYVNAYNGTNVAQAAIDVSTITPGDDTTPIPTPTDPIPTPTDPTPTPTSGIISSVTSSDGKKTLAFQVTPTVKDKTATATVPSETVNKALKDAISMAGQSGSLEVIFNIAKQDQVSKIALTIPGAAFANISTSVTDAFTVSTSFATITFDKKSIESILAGGNADVTFSMVAVDVSTLSLTDEIKKQLSDRPVYDFIVMKGNQVISNFNGGLVSIAIPYTLRDGEDSNAIVVYYLDDAGKLQVVNGSYNLGTKTVKILLSHISKYVVGYNKVTFTDVITNVWYSGSVNFVAARNLFNGVGNDMFAPHVAMNRAMFVKVVANLEGVDLSSYKTSAFSDVDMNEWYAPAVAWATEKGIIQGVGNEKFAPDMEITREQMAVMLYNYMVYKGITLPVIDNTSFADSASVSPWAAMAVTTIQKYGIINGVGNDLYAPRAVADRASVAQVIMNFMKAWVR